MWRYSQRSLGCTAWYPWRLLHSWIRLDWQWTLCCSVNSFYPKQVLGRQDERQVWGWFGKPHHGFIYCDVWIHWELLFRGTLLVDWGWVSFCQWNGYDWAWVRQVLCWLCERTMHSRLWGICSLRWVCKRIQCFIWLRRRMLWATLVDRQKGLC